MSTRTATTAAWVIALAMIIPGATISAEEPPPIPPPVGAEANGGPDYGIVSTGDKAGAMFTCEGYSGLAYLAHEYTGVEGHGVTGVRGYGSTGVEGYGNPTGGSFKSTGDYLGYAYVGYSDSGIKGYGEFTGGRFGDLDSGSYGYVGYWTYKIYGNGAVSFAQNHPRDPASVIVYAAPEGDEVATYTRGTARLVDGVARVALGETFAWVTNPDIGLTVHLTPVGGWSGLYVAEKGTEELVVRSAAGDENGVFDYLVYGLRIGFEESSIVQEKEEEAYIPSMSDHRELYGRRPDLRRYSALERFKSMRQAVGEDRPLDLGRAEALRDAIEEFDPALHQPPDRN